MGVGRHDIPGRALAYDVALAAVAGLLLILTLRQDPWRAPEWQFWIAVPAVALMARFPVVLLRQTSGIEVGLDPSVLVFLAIVANPPQAAVVWSVASVVAQFSLPKQFWTRLLNTAVCLIAGLLALATMAALREPGQLGLPGLLAVLAGATVYFCVDYVASALAIALLGRTTLRGSLWDVNLPIALVCFGGVCTLGYLSGVLAHVEPWAAPLMSIPLVALVLAARANADAELDHARVRGLFEAAARAQRGTTAAEITDTIVTAAREVLRCPGVRLGTAAGDLGELSAPVPGAPGQPDRWLVGQRRVTGEPFCVEDRQALEALAALAAESLQRVELVAELARTARRDSLTGLANRAVFHERVDQALRRRDARLAVLFCDLDGFKAVNDTFGHEAGDGLLVTVGERLAACLRPEDLVARLGGDEFGVLLEDVPDEEAWRVAQRLLAACREPLAVSGRSVTIGCSVGIAVADTRAWTGGSAAVLQNADSAMYRAKAAGKNGAAIFDSDMRSEEVDRLDLNDELRGAAGRGELVVHYQPVIDFRAGTVDGVEVLVRWNHPTRGLLQPDAFLPTAEETGLVSEVGEWVRAQAMIDGRLLSAAAGRQMTVAVNASPREIQRGAILEQIQTGCTPDWQLVLEITETTLAQPEVVPVLEELRRRGVRLMMDDFGTGYSSIARLRQLPVDGIKLDHVFIAHVVDDARDAGVVAAVVQMAEALGLVLVAEGIETGAQLATLRALGCTLGQGFHLARPMPLDRVLVYLAGHRDVTPVRVAS